MIRPLVATGRATPLRSVRGWLLRLGRRLSLSQRFLIAAVLVVALAMVLLGNWIGVYLQQGITNGVVNTAAASIESLVTHQVGEIAQGQEVTPEQRARLDAAFQIGNEAAETRLLQIRVRDLSGNLLYESATGLLDREDEGEDFQEASAGAVTARIVDVLLAPVGPIEGLPLTVLEIYTPLHRVGDGTVFAIAELYYSATTLIELRDKAQRDVWVLVGLFGILVVAALYLLVSSASTTIGRQRGRLAANLAASRRLAAENRALRVAADQLRLSANSANEALLAQVGSDIHDGPIQLLTLIILRLSRATGASGSDLAPLVQLASETMEDLRNISTGLVLPELAESNLEQTLSLAVQRHEDQTGTAVARQFGRLDGTVTLAVKIAAYRVVQEALTNAFRHGGGIGEAVTAGIDDGVLSLTVENTALSGPKAVASNGDARLGLRGMRFRVESLGGELDVSFGATRTRVTARLPLGAGQI